MNVQSIRGETTATIACGGARTFSDRIRSTGTTTVFPRPVDSDPPESLMPSPAEQSIPPQPTLRWVSERHLEIAFAHAISTEVQERVHVACEVLRGSNLAGLLDMTPAYASVLLEFGRVACDSNRIEAHVLDALRTSSSPRSTTSARLIEIPVCYDPELGADLEAVATHHTLAVEELVRLHSSAAYTVGFVGFMPGFAYLHGLPRELATPRLQSPRARVPAGSVGIAGDQTGVYPSASPGGWQLIGRTPLRMFDAARSQPSLLAMGDRVRFVPITRAQFDTLTRAGGA